MECKESELNWKIIRHPLCQLRASPCFDLRIFYLKFSSFEVDESTPEHLTLYHIPLSPETIIEVNDKRSNMNPEYVSSLLRRDRVDKNTEEATFVATDNIRMSGSVRFEVYDKGHLLLSGALELCNSNGFTGASKNHYKKWNLSCQQEMSRGSGFLKGKKQLGPVAFLPTVDVYVTGCFSNTPIILTKTLQLGLQKKHHQKAMLHSIPEFKSAELKKDVPSEASKVNDEFGFYSSENDMDDPYYTYRMKYLEDEGGEISLFNAGVRMGAGITVGVCLGVGVGIGLLVRTYQATSRCFKRRLI